MQLGRVDRQHARGGHDAPRDKHHLKAGFSLSTIAKAITAYASFTTASSTGLSAYQAQVLSASGSGEFCYDDSDHAHGAMTYYLLKVAANGDLNGDGAVTVLEAFSLVKAGDGEKWNIDHPLEAFMPHFLRHPALKRVG